MTIYNNGDADLEWTTDSNQNRSERNIGFYAIKNSSINSTSMFNNVNEGTQDGETILQSFVTGIDDVSAELMSPFIYETFISSL